METEIRRSYVYTVDAFQGGIALGEHKVPAGRSGNAFALHLEERSGTVPLRGRYFFHRDNPRVALERQLMKLSKAGVLRRSTIYFGVTSDPFLPFESKFDLARQFLEVFERYVPGLLHIQTRSSLVVLMMPLLKSLGKHVAVTIGIETPLEDVVKRYTPELPTVGERLRTVRALRECGIQTNLQVAPVLPYGDWKHDAPAFAEQLVNNADHVVIAAALAPHGVDATSSGRTGGNFMTNRSRLVRALSASRQYFWLRPDSALPLLEAVTTIAPEKLKAPTYTHLEDPQLSIFAA